MQQFYFTRRDRKRFRRAALLVRDQVDVELGRLLLRLLHGDEATLPAIHERLNVLGQFEIADWLRSEMKG